MQILGSSVPGTVPIVPTASGAVSRPHDSMPRPPSLDAPDFERFYRSSRRRTLHAAYVLVRNWPTAERITMQVFLRLRERLQAGQPVACPQAFVLRQLRELASLTRAAVRH
jgi:hypothetical protein